MKYPITTLFTLMFVGLVQLLVFLGWYTENLLFTIERLGILGFLGVAASGFSLAYIRLLAQSIKKFWSFKMIFTILFHIQAFAFFLGILYLVIMAWAERPHYIE